MTNSERKKFRKLAEALLEFAESHKLPVLVGALDAAPEKAARGFVPLSLATNSYGYWMVRPFREGLGDVFRECSHFRIPKS